MTEKKPPGVLDQLCDELDHALRSLAGAGMHRSLPEGCDEAAEDSRLSEEEARRSAALMRVNMAGELAAQGLYRGQALTARDERTRQHLLAAADEEQSHLDWCHRRILDLGAAPSLLNPLWYGGSVLLGAAAGLAGDSWSLGFVAETERQVADHLQGHLRRLPPGDTVSRRILEQMHSDEVKHGDDARRAGGKRLPATVAEAMAATAAAMTKTAEKI